MIWSVIVVAAGVLPQVGGFTVAYPDHGVTVAESEGDAAVLDDLLRTVSERQKTVQTLRARFRQLRDSPLLLGPEESSGRFTYRAPDAARWDYESPEPMTVLITGDSIATCTAGRGTPDRRSASKHQRNLLQLLTGSEPIDELYRKFDAVLTDEGEPSPFHISLTPRSGKLKKRLAKIDISIDRRQLLPTRVEYLEADGERTVFELFHLEVNQSIPQGHFILERCPPEVVRAPLTAPLDGDPVEPGAVC